MFDFILVKPSSDELLTNVQSCFDFLNLINNNNNNMKYTKYNVSMHNFLKKLKEKKKIY